VKAAFRRKNKQSTQRENGSFLIYRAHMVSWRLRKHLEDNMLPSQRLTVDVYIRHIYMCGPIKSSDK